MLETLRQHIAADLQHFMERLNGCGVGAWVRLCRKERGISR